MSLTEPQTLEYLQSVSLSFLFRNNTQKEHPGHEISQDENGEKDWDETRR